MPERVASKPALADATAASADRTAAWALATRVSEAKPPSDNLFAALKFILASSRRASASSRRAWVSGTRARANSRRAFASAKFAARVPGSSSHKTSPWATKAPLRRGVLTISPFVSARAVTLRAACVSPRKITALSMVCARERLTTTLNALS